MSEREMQAPGAPVAAEERPGAQGPAPAPRQRHMRRWLTAALLVALTPPLLYALAWVGAFALAQLGPLGALALALLAGLLLATVGPWLLVRYSAPIRAAIGRAAAPLWRWSRLGTLHLPFSLRFPRLSRRLGIRFFWSPMAGLFVAAGALVVTALAWAFLDLAYGVVAGSSLTGVDRRIINLSATLRTPALDSAMYGVTILANAPTVVVVAAVAVALALLARRRADALLIALSLAAGAAFFIVVKALVARPRPPLEDARIIQGGFSFPSGHATLSATVYGTIAYLLIHGGPHARLPQPLRIGVAVAAALLIAAVGVSRVYLGVHYPSDVLAGWTAGAVWLALVVVAEHLWLPRATPPLSPLRRGVWLAGALAAISLAAVYVSMVDAALPPPPAAAAPTLVVIAADDAQATVMARLPHYTETLSGAHQEPVNLVFVGTRADVERAFAAAGWTEAERPGFANVGHALLAGVGGRPDAAAPVTPSFLAEEPNALAFNQPVGETLARRHHVRLWSTDFETGGGRRLWLATASFDQGFELAPNSLLPTHHIAPDIDSERGYLVESLASGGAVAEIQVFQLVPPESGHNFAGDLFYTDGRAALLALA